MRKLKIPLNKINLEDPEPPCRFDGRSSKKILDLKWLTFSRPLTLYNEESEFYKALASYYLKIVHIKDQWGGNFIVYCGEACEGKYGISYPAEDDFLVCSFGQDKKMEYYWSFDYYDEKAGLFTVYSIDDFDKDLVNYNGAWIRVPLYFMKK